MKDLPENEQATPRVPRKIGLAGHVSLTLGHYDADGELIAALPPVSVPAEALHPDLFAALESAAVEFVHRANEVKRMEAERIRAEREAQQRVQQAMADTQAALKATRAEITAETGQHPLSDDPRLVALRARRKKIQELQEAFTAALAEAE